MSLNLPQTCNMGDSQTGLAGTIGVTLLNPDGTVKTARTTDGIYEIGGGTYGKIITFDDNWSGVIVWDTGGDTPYYAVTEYNLEGMADAIKEKTDNQPAGIQRNVALNNFEFLMVLNSDHVTPATGKTVVGEISQDGNAFSSLTNTITEVEYGIYKIDLTQIEMNAGIITLKFTANGCDQRIITIKTNL